MKYFVRICVVVFCMLISDNIFSQVIDYSSTFRSIHRESYFRFHYDNDYFTKTDYYYSQGITLEHVNPKLKRNPLSRLLLKSNGSFNKYGLSFDLFGYTPTSTESDSILLGDRPFAASITIRSFVVSTDTVNKKRISSAIVVGVIGPAGLGNEIHTGIHRWLKNPLPHGWNNQIRNDIVLNYQVNYEKELIGAGHFLLNAVSELRIGTLNDKISAGFNFMAGNFNDPYKEKSSKKVEYYFYGQVRGSIIPYDASMQGGLLNRESPYIISSPDIERATFQADAGVIVNLRKFYFSYTQSFLSSEFRTGKYHRWGGISVGFAL